MFTTQIFADSLSVVDSLGRTVAVPASPDRVICSGSGCLRLLVYLQAQDRVIAVDSAEDQGNDVRALAARPYSQANPQFRNMPVFGEFRGMDSPELIAGLTPQPQVIFKVSPLSGPHPDVLTEKTGIPVIGLEYGNLTDKREQLYETLRTMGRVLGREDRADEVVGFLEKHREDLARRTADIPEERRPTCYVGGVASRGTHGITSTEPGYPPFLFTNARNVAASGFSGKSEVIQISKEQLLAWDPEVLFLDANTTRSADQANAMSQLRDDPALATLSAVTSGNIWGVLPYNSYNTNYGSVLANCYFVGKAVFQEIEASFPGFMFSKLDIGGK